MNVLILFSTGVLIGITGAIIPGPLTLFTVSEVMKSNRFAGLKVIFGHIVTEFLLILIIFLGLYHFLKSQILLRATTAVGGIALVAMGAILFLKSPRMKSLKDTNGSHIAGGLFLGGIFFSIASPGFIVWWVTIGLSTVMRSLLHGIIGVAILSLGHWTADIIWYWSLSYAVDKGKNHLSERNYRNIVRALSALLGLLGLYFLYQSLFLTK
ncbi:MAG: LysE family transporter [Candidatus Omnitrophica bacterium]|nr:LysE family transporter [Candidatus Omnitrophota bacterium]